MTKDTTKEAAVAAEALLLDDWFDAIEDGVRARARGFIETMLEEELSEALSRPRYGRRKPGEDEAAPSVVGVRHGHRERTLTGTFGKTRIAVPRARLTGEDGKTREWRSGSLRAYQRRTRAADALIAGAYLAGTNTRRVRRALNAVFAGPVGKDVVSRVWRKTKGDWDAWNARSLGRAQALTQPQDGLRHRKPSTPRWKHRARRASVLVSLVFSRDKLVDGDLCGALPQCFYVRDSSIDLGLPQMAFGHDSGYRTTMSGDDNRLPALDVIEKLREVSS